MPGVPPDALAQVKKGLRGLFNRKKSKPGPQQPTEPDPEPTSGELPTDTSAAPARAIEDTQDVDPTQPASAPTPTPAHHISTPSGMEEAKAVDLNPAKVVDEAPKGSKATPSSTGMSATSGPLGDHMAEVYRESGNDQEGEAGGG